MSAPAERSLRSRLARDTGALCSAGLVLIAVELALIGARASVNAGDVVRYAAVSFVVLGWLAILLGAASAALATLGHGVLARFVRPGIARWIAAVATGSIVGMIGVEIIRPWDLRSDPAQFAISVPAAAVLGALAFRVAADRAAPLITLALCLAASAAVIVADASFYRGLYVTLHRAALWFAWLSLAYAFGIAWTQLSARSGRWLLALPVAWGLAHAGLGAAQSALELAVIHGSVLPNAASVLRALDDSDHDGYAPRWASGDCDDGDPEVRPGRCEVPDNRRDDNCNGLVDPPAEARNAVPRTPLAKLPDVYLVMIDTLRADFGGPGRAEVSPTLERLAQHSLDFTRAYAPYPATFRSLSAMAHSVGPRTYDPSSRDFITSLVQHGYDAQLWIADRRLPIGTPSALWPLRKDSHPFSNKITASSGEHSQRICDEAIAELTVPSEQPRFRWLHVLDLHTPWLHAPATGDLRSRYLAELAHVEAVIAPLFAALAAHERTREAAIIVLGDHGEQLGEHWATFHDAFVWEESIRVPLLMRLPGVTARRIDPPASLLDVAPTLLHALGIAEPASFQGHDWLASPERRANPPIAEVTETGLGRWGPPARIAVIGERYKLSLNVTDNMFELYDLQNDPGETRLLRRDRVPEAAELLEQLRRYQDHPGCRL
jgi:hypothetical protein